MSRHIDADKLERGDLCDICESADCSNCFSEYEGEQDLFEIGCDLFRRFKNDAILVLADIRGDNNG